MENEINSTPPCIQFRMHSTLQIYHLKAQNANQSRRTRTCHDDAGPFKSTSPAAAVSPAAVASPAATGAAGGQRCARPSSGAAATAGIRPPAAGARVFVEGERRRDCEGERE